MATLPRPRPPNSSGMVRPNTPSSAQLLDHRERDVLVLQVPLVRVRQHLGFGEAAHLAADRLQRLVEAGVAERAVRVGCRSARRAAAWRRVAAGDQPLDGVAAMARDRLPRRGRAPEPHDLALAHRDAAEDLRQIFADADPVSSSSVSPKRPSAERRSRRRASRAPPRHRSRARRGRGRRAAPLEQLGGQRAVGADLAPHGGRRLELQASVSAGAAPASSGQAGSAEGARSAGGARHGRSFNPAHHGSLAFAVQQRCRLTPARLASATPTP